MTAEEIDGLVERLFIALGVPIPYDGSIKLEFHERKIRKVRPEAVITVNRNEAETTSALAKRKPSLHTPR